MLCFGVYHPGRANAELANKLRETQNELMASRAEAVQLHAHVLNLQVKIAWLKGQLRDTRSQLAATQRGSLASLPTDVRTPMRLDSLPFPALAVEVY